MGKQRSIAGTGRLPLELLPMAVVLACVCFVGWVQFERAHGRSLVAQVHSDFSMIRRGIQAYQADHQGLPLHTWPCPPHADQIDGTLAGETLTYGITTPIAYLKTLPVDPFLDNPELPMATRLYRYGSSDYFELLMQVGSSCPERKELAYAPGSPAEIDTFNYYFGRYFLLSAGPDGQYHPGNNLQFGMHGTSFQQYDATNGAMSWGNIFVTERRNVPEYVPINAFP